ncbi:MAG: substrate-binding periplasmic protein [Vogesella sp.]|uniref:substrate-binding periplasmic protein n=1 Tax=Vogesella sp. TaxID=1904252 RepID=UPI00391C103F
MRAVLSTLALLLACSTVPAGAQRLVFAFNTAEPYKVLDANGRPAGAYVDIMRELARRSQLVLQIEQAPLKRVLAMLENGSADISIGIKGGPERDAYLQFLDPPFAPSSRTVVLQRASDPRQLRHYDDLLPLRIGVVEGVNYFPRFDADLRLRRDAAPNVDSALRKLLAKRFDVLMINSLQAQSELRHLRYRDLIRTAAVSFEFGDPRRIAISRRSPVAQQQQRVLSQHLAAMVKDGTIARMLAKADAAAARGRQP